MGKQDTEFNLEISRRKLLAAAGIGGGVVVAASLIGTGEAQDALPARPSSDPVATPPVAGLHLQFGADASSEMVVSWHTLQPVRNPRVVLGHLDGKLEQKVEAKAMSYTDAKSGRVVYAYHAKVAGLQADFTYLYAAMHDGAEPEFATFRTSPRGRAPFTFTSFGDQGTPTLGKKFVPPAGVTLPKLPYVNDNLGSPAAGDTTLGVERLQPLFHLFNGDLCYANLAEDRVRTWWDFWENNSRSARKRPWMPSPGNHENELGNGPIGYQAYQTYFSVPEAAGQTDVTRGLWYAFTAGSVRVISIANDDVVYQDGGNSYVRGYSAGAQKAWLEKELGCDPCQSRYRLDRRVHAPGRHLDGRQVQWRGPRNSRGMGAVVRQIRRRSRGVRARASLRALASDPRPGIKRHADARSCGDRDRRDRHQQGDGAHGDRRRRNVDPVERAVLQSASVSRHYRRRRTRPGDWQASACLRARARALVGGAKRGACLRLRGFHRRSGRTSW